MSTVLVVDDSISVRKALERILMPHNHTVLSADSAESALETLSQESPDLVIADVVMPGMDGFELCQTLKADSQFQEIPVILISGIVNATVEEQAREVGAEDVIKKPFNPTDLMPAIDQALSQHADVETGDASEVVPEVIEAVPEATPTVNVDAFSSLRQALKPFIDKEDIESVLVVNPQGDCLLHLGKPLPDEGTIASYFKFFTSASSILGEKLDIVPLKGMLLEYQNKCLMLTQVSNAISIILTLRDVSVVSLARFLTKKHLETIEDALSVEA